MVQFPVRPDDHRTRDLSIPTSNQPVTLLPIPELQMESAHSHSSREGDHHRNLSSWKNKIIEGVFGPEIEGGKPGELCMGNVGHRGDDTRRYARLGVEGDERDLLGESVLEDEFPSFLVSEVLQRSYIALGTENHQ